MDDIHRLRAELDEVQNQNATVERETQLMRSYYERVVLGASNSEEAAGEEGSGGRRGRGGKRGRGPTALTAEQKLEIVTAELEETLRLAAAEERKAQQTADTVRAMGQHVKIRLSEVRKEKLEFERSILQGAIDERTGMAKAERVVRWMEDKGKQRDTLVDKLRLKTRTLTGQRRKLAQQVKSKEELGDVLHYIDYHQLQIENKQYLARIEERNAELLQLKVATGRALQALNDRKARLSQLERECSRMRSEISTRSDLRERLTQEEESVKTTIEKAKHEGAALAAGAEDSGQLPGVIDYVTMQKMHEELKKEVQSWERKLDIVQVGAKQASRKRRQARQAASTATPGAYDHVVLARAAEGAPVPEKPLVMTKDMPHARASRYKGKLVTGRLVQTNGAIPPAAE